MSTNRIAYRRATVVVWARRQPLSYGERLWEIVVRRPYVVIGDAADPRVVRFRRALWEVELADARVVDYRELAWGRVDLAEAAPPRSRIRIESPGRRWEVYRALLARGADAAAAEGDVFLDAQRARRLGHDRGRIVYPRQWYLGFRDVLREIRRQVRRRRDLRFTSQPEDIETMFDKTACHARLREAGIPTAAPLGPVRSYEELIRRMKQGRRSRVFVKLRHGSSASGVVAYETNWRRHQAHTTVEMVSADGRLVLYNSRRLHRYTRVSRIAQLIDALCQHGVHVEAWVPKAGAKGRTCDLRVVTIRGEPTHMAARMSRGPMTNLHLGSRRAGADVLRSRMSTRAWDAMLDSCRRVAAVFGRTLHVGIDVAVTPDWRKHAVLEVNAFGDLLHGVTRDGLDTYAAEIDRCATRTK